MLYKKANAYELVLSIAKFFTKGLHLLAFKRRHSFEWQSVWEGVGGG